MRSVRAGAVHRARRRGLGEERGTHLHATALRDRGESDGGGEGPHEDGMAVTALHDGQYTPLATRRPCQSSWAFSATTTVDTDMSTAPSAGDRRTPALANTPAASGIATAL